ncbi:hypothetical protein RB620_11310 [Paenibacillus sp. LHD-117]|uniref:hypothetical protein n=1 Tax=Paenibacillus sp. LHD-117 TaxID=3071412 RepID=UPI0027E0E488|nr:hypothetical protein [Paenibacillus sp. LHD-117]MDQ6420023.1 hypothetical protein [Paenibacillus sp. LHD-117]
MTHDDKKQPQAAGSPRLFTPDGKPLKVLSTSLGIALLANAVLSTGVSATSATTGSGQPKLVSWSTEEVKAYFDATVDWSLPMPPLEDEEEDEPVASSGGSSSPTVIHHYGSGFGWDDLLLYHLLFNNGGSYSSSGYYKNRPAYYSTSKTRYTPKTYTSDMFQNKQVAGTSVKPKTSSSTGSVTRRSTSSSPGGIGGNSSGLSSSGSKSSVSSSGSNSSSGSKSSGFGG